MISSSLKKLFLVCLATLFIASPALAKDYIVDLVIFESLTPEAASDYSSNLYYPLSRNAVELGGSTANNAGFRVVDANTSMKSIAGKLQSSGRYRVISHLSWQQPGLAESTARPVKLSFGQPVNLYLPVNAVAENHLIRALTPGTEISAAQAEAVQSAQLSGTVTLSLGKYLHLKTNLVLIKPDGSGSTRMQIDRRMRSREFHYLDNPRFGLIVLTVPVD
ncbi:MAG: hypothetical protein KDJ38_10955 [Gammaproteobacteria bacterium]|nr:hypothetical protein [Gammaproteobacteria bacterium]